MKYVIANYKMNGDVNFFKNVNKTIINKDKDTKVILCPPFVYLQNLKMKKDIALGCQDIACQIDGKSTGQISPNMLKELGVKYVIIGHSERRVFESDEMINKKIKLALKYDLIPIVCVGESERADAKKFVTNQVKSALKDIDNNSKIILAYEPLWAIGSGVVPTNKDIDAIIKAIKCTAGKLGFDLPVLYGGSVSDKNINELKSSLADGFLVGSACLNKEKFNTIINGAN